MKTFQKLRQKILGQSCLGSLLVIAVFAVMIIMICGVHWPTTALAAQTPQSVDIKAKELFRPTEAMFHVQNEDIAVTVLRPILDESSTKDHLVIVGYNPTVVIPDYMEFVGTPQCHWDGIHESTRWAYTIYVRHGSTGRLATRQINLADFMSAYPDALGSKLVRLGVISGNNSVEFTTMPFSRMNLDQGMNPWDFVETEE
ncbi:MAG: hypothetical protein WC711_00870 [Candidatus Staskawiczbacteria bacterium]|jgi:hypothetical protein